MIFWVNGVADLLRNMEGDEALFVGVAVDDRQRIEPIQAELVYIDADGNVRGTEADDYRPQLGERLAWMLSPG